MESAPVNTLNYMIGGYAVIFGTMILYLVSLVIRTRNLEQDETMLKELEKEDKRS